VIGSPAKRVGKLLATVAAIALVSCGHSAKHTTADPTTTTAAAASTTTTSPTEAAVVNGWRHYWDIYVSVGGEMKLPDPRLAQVAIGDELRQLGGGFLAFSSDGQVLRGTIDLAPVVTSVQGTQATLRDCYFSHILRYDKTTGQAKGTAPTERTLVTVTMQFDSGAWKVAAIKHEGDGCSSAA
jgi:hypothetical protein